MPRARRREEELEESETAALERADAPVPPVVALGRLAGNRAVSGLLQRQGGYTPTISPPPISLNIPPTSKLAGEPAKGLTPDVAAGDPAVHRRPPLRDRQQGVGRRDLDAGAGPGDPGERARGGVGAG